MKFLALKKALSVGLGLILLSEPAMAAVAESSLWEERQLAALPQGVNPHALLQHMPSIQGSLPTKPTWTPIKKTNNGKLNDVLGAISLSHSRIQDVHDSGESSIPPVIIIQDIHLNPEAQNNIAAVIQKLIDEEKVSMVGVEGAFEALDFSPFRNFSDKEITKEVAQAFLDSQNLAAPSFVGMTSTKEPPLFVGVDDPAHHQANVDAYLSTRSLIEKTRADLLQAKQNLNRSKEKLFSEELKVFDALQTSFQSGKLAMGPYLQKLSQYNVDTDLSIDQFLEAYKLELNLNFLKVDRERKRVIQKLAHALDKETLSDLVEQSLAYRMGRMGFGDYYANLKKLCEKNGLNLKRTPAFDNYIRYVLLSDGIRAQDLFESMRKLEVDIQKQLAQTDEQLRLANESRFLGLVEKLIDFRLTPSEWEEYKETVQRTAYSVQRDDPMYDVRRTMYAFEKFYEEAEIRSHIMVEKLLNPKP